VTGQRFIVSTIDQFATFPEQAARIPRGGLDARVNAQTE
jgi:hypothetical protein